MFTNDEIRKLAAMRFEESWMEDLAIKVAGDHGLEAVPCAYLRGLLFGMFVARDIASHFAFDDLTRSVIGDALFAAAIGSARACHEALLDELLIADKGHSC